jgi:hypothetical protein
VDIANNFVNLIYKVIIRKLIENAIAKQRLGDFLREVLDNLPPTPTINLERVPYTLECKATIKESEDAETSQDHHPDFHAGRIPFLQVVGFRRNTYTQQCDKTSNDHNSRFH